MDLFRSEALQRQAHRLSGDVVVLPRPHHHLLALLLLTWLVLVGFYLSQANFARSETVRGWITPQDGVVRVYPRQAGKVAELLVEAGERVSAGQALARLEGEHVLAGGDHLEQLLLQEYQQQDDAISRRIERLQAVHRESRSSLLDRIRIARGELRLLRAQGRALDQRFALDERRYQRIRNLLPAGHTTDSEIEHHSLQLLLDRENRLEHSARLQRHLALMTQLESELQQLPLSTQESIDQLQMERSTLAQSMVQLKANYSRTITAPIDGVIGHLQLDPGASVQPDVPMLTVLPENSSMIAHLLVPVRAAGFVQAGQELQLRIDAFPYQKYGTHHGRVYRVSDSTVHPGEWTASPLPVLEPIYRVSAKLTNSESTTLPYSMIKPGMTFSADIRLEDRSLLRWLLEPLFTMRGRML